MRARAQVTAPGAITSMIVAMSTRPSRQIGAHERKPQAYAGGFKEEMSWVGLDTLTVPPRRDPVSKIRWDAPL